MTKEQLTVLTRKYLDGTATTEEKALLEKWYYSFDTRELTIELPEGEDEHLLSERIKSGIDRRNANGRTSVSRYRMAAVVFLLITGGLLATFLRSRQVYNSGQQPRFVVLQDGSKVWLNTATRLVYMDIPFMGERRLSLTGEAYFDVVRDPEKPFIIRSGNMTTQVLGTAFNIKAYPDEPFYITVTNGKIRLENKKTNTVAFLTSNKQFKYTNQHQPVVAEVKAAEAHAWTKGQLDFHDQSFDEIARTISRKYNVKVIFANRSLQECMITASFEKETPVKRLVELLCKINNATYTFNADSTVVTLNGEGCK